ncbi:hypothetical protein XENTR_v10024684 [Xenopus tropicalis]|nr:hypothetical protein XENTR_v10024684 [Xenopus tropicalis]
MQPKNKNSPTKSCIIKKCAFNFELALEQMPVCLASSDCSEQCRSWQAPRVIECPDILCLFRENSLLCLLSGPDKKEGVGGATDSLNHCGGGAMC